ncbi:MAG: LPD7 domain-containing protein [Candidatus Adiutrix sp.]
MEVKNTIFFDEEPPKAKKVAVAVPVVEAVEKESNENVKNTIKFDAVATKAKGKADAEDKALAVPFYFANKFIIEEPRYFFKSAIMGAKKDLAFIDNGTSVTTDNRNVKNVTEHMLSLAKERGWECIKVAGTSEFIKEVEKVAKTMGITVTAVEEAGVKPPEEKRAPADKGVPNEKGAKGEKKETASPPKDASSEQAPKDEKKKRSRARP